MNVTLIAGRRFPTFIPRHKNISSRDQEGGPLPGGANQTKSPQILAAGRAERADGLSPVIANGLDRAAFLGFLAASFFLRRLRLLENIRIAAVFVAFEILRRGFAAQVAVNTLVIDVILARNILRILVSSVSHNVFYIGFAIWSLLPAMASPFSLF